MPNPEQVIFDTTQDGLLEALSAVASTGNTLDASSERECYYGRVGAHHWSTGTKTITAVDMVFSTVTNGTGTTTVRLSLRDVDTTTGVPPRDDGVVDQSATKDITTITANTITTFTLDTGRTVSIGDELCVVIDFTAFGTAPALNTRVWSSNTTGNYPGVSSYIGTPAWTGRGGWPNCRLVCDDGSYIYLGPPYAFLAGTNTSGDYNLNTTGSALFQGDEKGNLWVPKQAWDITRIALPNRASTAGSSAELTIFRDTTALDTHTILANRLYGLSVHCWYEYVLPTPIRVNAGENIRITHRPLGTENWRTQGAQCGSVNDRLGLMKYDPAEPLRETDVQHTQRIDQGSFTQPTSGDASVTYMRVYGRPVNSGGRIGSSTLVGPTRW